jgi:multiple sugar transport system substrate-binding protein
MDKQQKRQRLTRRQFLKTGAAGLGAVALGSLPGRVFGQAPAVIKGTRLAIIQVSYFIAPAQELFKKQAEEWGKANGVTMAVDFVNHPDLQPKISAAVQAGGVDIVELFPGWNHLYKDNLVDLTEEAEEFGRRGGGFEKYVVNSGPVAGRWLGIPHGMSNGSINYRIGWFKDAGIENAEDGNKLDWTWGEYHAVAKKCKAAGHPFGQALGHSPGDPPGFFYPYMWSYGAMEIDKEGKSVQFNKPEFVEGIRQFVQAWKDGYDTTGTSWDDSANNRGFLSEQLAATYNGSSIYFVAKKDKPNIARDMSHMLMPRGPAGRFYWLGTRMTAILKNSKNVLAAKEFLKWWFQDEQFGPWWRIQDGYQLQPVVKYYNDPIWFKDPKMTPFREQPKYGVDLGWPGPPNQKASLAYAKYIVVDTFAKCIQGADPKATVEWGAEELKRAYGV